MYVFVIDSVLIYHKYITNEHNINVYNIRSVIYCLPPK